jgi:hypothetical protein
MIEVIPQKVIQALIRRSPRRLRRLRRPRGTLAGGGGLVVRVAMSSWWFIGRRDDPPAQHPAGHRGQAAALYRVIEK